MILVEPPRTAWDLKWTMLRTPVRVHPWFWLVSLLLCYHELLPFGMVLTSMACLLFSVLVHEFGHAMCGRYYGDRGSRVVIYSLGGLCISDREPPGHWPRILISLWGPGAGFILGALAFCTLWASRTGHVPALDMYPEWALRSLVWFNLVWGAVNLLPIFPLDGGQIFRELAAWKAPRRGDRFAFRVSFYAALVMAVLGLALYFFEPAYGLVPMLFFVVMAYSTWDLLRQLSRYGGLAEHEAPRQPWEQDSDWWKK